MSKLQSWELKLKLMTGSLSNTQYPKDWTARGKTAGDKGIKQFETLRTDVLF